MKDLKKTDVISFTPDLAIGTEFYVMSNNKPMLGLIAEINAHITTCTNNKKGWHEQLFGRFINKTHKDIYEVSYEYYVKVENDISRIRIDKEDGVWYFLGEKMYFSLKELKNNL